LATIHAASPFAYVAIHLSTDAVFSIAIYLSKANTFRNHMEKLDQGSIRRLLSRLRFRHLQLLVTLSEMGSLHAASTKLNQTQSAISKSLNEIEGAFGFLLFERSSRGISPTSRGAIAIKGAVMLIHELEHLGKEVMSDDASTVLRLGAPPFIAHGYLPQVLHAFLTMAQDVRLELMEERAPILFDALLQGRLDALVTIFPPELLRGSDQGFVLEKLFDAEFVVVAATQNPLVDSRKVSWSRISQESWIMPPPNAMLRRVLDDGFQRAGLKTPIPKMESSNPATNLQLVAKGIGLGIIPKQTLHAAEGQGLVNQVRVSPALIPLPVALVTKANSNRTDLLRKLLIK
jgi:LysR family transcriptional regulator, regulator of abg operon